MTDFTVADVLAWARTKPADERYNYQDPGHCALCQFLRDTRRAERPSVDMYSIGFSYGGWRDFGSKLRPYPREMEPALSGSDWDDLHGDEDGWTFGALVERLEKLCPDTPKSDWLRIDAYLTDIEQVSA